MCGVTIGVLSGLYQGRWLDRSLTVVALGGVSIPIFWLGAVLLYLLTFKWHTNPLFGVDPVRRIRAAHPGPRGMGVASVPAVDRAGGRLDRLLLAGGARTRCWTTLHQDYIRTARSKGLSEWRVLTRHTLRTCLIPVVTLFGLDFGAAVGGTVILIEPIFGLEGSASTPRSRSPTSISRR